MRGGGGGGGIDAADMQFPEYSDNVLPSGEWPSSSQTLVSR